MALGFVLLKVGLPEFSFSDPLWQLFERPGGASRGG
jgi:hypothetical protein